MCSNSVYIITHLGNFFHKIIATAMRIIIVNNAPAMMPPRIIPPTCAEFEPPLLSLPPIFLSSVGPLVGGSVGGFVAGEGEGGGVSGWVPQFRAWMLSRVVSQFRCR